MPDDDISTTSPEDIAADIVETAGDWSPFQPVEPAVSAAIAAVARFVEIPAGTQITVALSNDEEVRGLNRRYRGKDRPTNVLSFPAGGGAPVVAGEPEFLGDLVFAAETVLRETRELEISPLHHFQHLVVHGLLHLLGYDHEAEDQALEMEAIEVEILASLGIADPYTGELETAKRRDGELEHNERG